MRINEKNYVDKAEKVISDLAEESKVKNRGRVNIVTTSKLRNLLAMTADIYIIRYYFIRRRGLMMNC